MKVEITSGRVKVRGQFAREGSILANTIHGSCREVAVELEIESPAGHDQIAQLIRNAENSCYVMQTIANPVPTRLTARHNNEVVPIPA